MADFGIVEVTVCWDEIPHAGIGPGDVLLCVHDKAVMDPLQRMVSLYILLPDGDIQEILA